MKKVVRNNVCEWCDFLNKKIALFEGKEKNEIKYLGYVKESTKLKLISLRATLKIAQNGIK